MLRRLSSPTSRLPTLATLNAPGGMRTPWIGFPALGPVTDFAAGRLTSRESESVCIAPILHGVRL
jgi:hypothetical protein